MSATAVAVLLVLGLAGAGAEAALPAPPFALEVTPARVRAGEAVTLRVTPRGGGGQFDLYLMWALAPEAAFLTPEGAWSPRPVAFRAGMAATGAPLVGRWTPSPPGDIPLALVVVPAGGDPLARFAWQFRPLVVEIGVQTPAGGAAIDAAALAPLALLTLLSCILVLRAGKPFLG